MNTYLIPYSDDIQCDIYKIVANSWEDCQQKIMDKYINRLEDDNLANIDDFEEFCDCLYNDYNIIIGNIHEIEDFE